jgi:hypothetical protein
MNTCRCVGIGRALDHRLAIDALRAIPGHEHVADAVMAGFRQTDSERGHDLLEEGVGNLHEDACAIARERIGAGRAAMGQVLENLKAVPDDRMARAPVEVGDKAHPASIMLALRVVESFRLRRRRPCRML